MALKNFKLDLTDVKATVNAGNKVFTADSADVEVVEGASTTVATAVTKDLASAKLDGFGTLKAIDDKVVTFEAAADMKSGAYKATMNANASIKTFDASKASAHLSLTTSLVSVNSGVLKAGSGNDTILVDNTTATGIQVYGGKGADVFEVSTATTVDATIRDYNYAQGDKVSIDAAIAMDEFDVDGQLTVGATTIVGSAADNVYKFGVIADKKYDYVAGITGADVNYTAGTDNLVFKAEGNGNVVIDASKATATKISAKVTNANITLGGNRGTQNSVVAGIDGDTDSSVFVDLGYGNDTVSVASAAALTLNVGREDGSNTLQKVLDANDTLKLTTGKISDVLMDNTDLTMLKFGATSIAGALNNSGSNTGAFNVKFGSGEAEKLAYTTNNANAIEYSKDVRHYLGVADSKITVAANSTDDVVLDMVNYTNGITSVKVAGIDAKANVDITATGNASIDATSAHDGVVWKFDLTAKDTAANPTYNVLNVTGANGVDRIVLSDVKGNKDSVNGFAAGEDILVLSDVAKLDEKTFSVTNSANVVLQKSKASIAGAFTAGTNLDVVLSDGTAKKVALADDADGKVQATQETTTVINQTDKDGLVTFNINEATENKAAFVVDMTGTVSNAIDYLGKFTAIDATVNAADALIIGKEAITSIKATGSADHGAVVWAGAKANAEINLVGPATNAGNIIWTGAQDGASSVKGFDEKDKLFVYGVDGLSKTDVAEGFKIAGNNVVYKTGESSMTFNYNANTTGNINVIYMDSTAEGGEGYQKVAYTNAVGTAVKFATDVDVYLGTGNAEVKVDNDAVAEGKIAVINLSNKGVGSVEDGGAYYKNIHNIDASASAGTFLLIGDNTDNAQLKGGVNGNAIWGGGNASQWMTGSTGVADIFWFGSNDGYDDVANFEKEDAVYLYDATSIDAVKITAEAGNIAKVVFEGTGCTLTLNGVSDIDDVKFMLYNADGGFDYYKYDSKTSAFVQQKA